MALPIALLFPNACFHPAVYALVAPVGGLVVRQASRNSPRPREQIQTPTCAHAGQLARIGTGGRANPAGRAAAGRGGASSSPCGQARDRKPAALRTLDGRRGAGGTGTLALAGRPGTPSSAHGRRRRPHGPESCHPRPETPGAAEEMTGGNDRRQEPGRLGRLRYRSHRTGCRELCRDMCRRQRGRTTTRAGIVRGGSVPPPCPHRAEPPGPPEGGPRRRLGPSHASRRLCASAPERRHAVGEEVVRAPGPAAAAALGTDLE